jgi:hypothetical protein
MSAYFCSSEVFASIASFACRQDPALDYSKVQKVLIVENLRSLNARYPNNSAENTTDAADRLKNVFSSFVDVDSVEVVKKIKEYDYQSCEHSGYVDSDAHTLLARLLILAPTLSVERARLAASLALPSAPELPILPTGANLPSPDRLRGAIILATLARLSHGREDGRKFLSLLENLTASESRESRAFIESEAAANFAAIKIALA